MKESMQESKGGEKERTGTDNQKTDWGDKGETNQEVRGKIKEGEGNRATVRERGEGGNKGRGCMWVGLQKSFGMFGAGRGGEKQ